MTRISDFFGKAPENGSRDSLQHVLRMHVCVFKLCLVFLFGSRGITLVISISGGMGN